MSSRDRKLLACKAAHKSVKLHREAWELRKTKPQMSVESSEMSRNFFRLCELTRDGVLICKGGTIIIANKATAELLGVEDPDSLQGVAVTDFVRQDDRQVLTDLLAQTGGPVSPSERALARIEGKDTKIEVIVNATTLHGEPVAQAILREAPDQTVTALASGSVAIARLQLVDLANSAILRWKSTGELTFVNKFAERFFGYSLEEVVGKSVMIFVPDMDSDGQDLTTLSQDIVADPERYVTNINENICRDGRRVWVSWTNRAIVDEQNRVVEILAVGNDISSLKHIEDELRRACDELRCAVEERTAALLAINRTLQEEIEERAATEKALANKAEELVRSNRDLEQFAYAVSHDLQEPLRNVSSCMQLLRNRYGEGLTSEADQLMKYAEDSTERMKNLINGLLKYSRVGTKGSPFEPRDCEQVLRDTRSDLHQAIEESGAEVTHDPLPTVRVDGSQLIQVFQNLIGNAIKFHGSEPPTIHISAKRDAEQWIFSVRDNGIGIAPEHTDKIFAVFKRLHGDSAYPGTGIGLAITKRIVERHGGRIWAESEPHVGSTFYFTLPATDDVGSDAGDTHS